MVRVYLLLIVVCFACPLLHGQTKDTIKDFMIITYIDEPPIFNGELKDFIEKNLKYPTCAPGDSIEGKVIISYWIDTNGVTINHEVIRGLTKNFDEEALRVTKLIRYEKPAMQGDKPIMVKFVVPVEFKRNRKK